MDTDVVFNIRVNDRMAPAIKKQAEANDKLATSTDNAKQATDSQNISFVAQIVAVNGLYTGFGRLTGSMHMLGLISDGTAEKIGKVHAAIGLVSGAFMMIKSAIAVTKALTAAETGLLSVETYRSVLKNPATLALVGVGIGAAAGVAGYYLGKSNTSDASGGGGSTTTVTQNVTYSGSAPIDVQTRRSQSRYALEAGGGY